MTDMERYYNNTESKTPRNNVQYYINEIQCPAGNAIDLGCGAGNDTVYLIQNNWNVVAIDKEDVEERIIKRLSKKELTKFTFQKQEFETLVLGKNKLVVANYSIPFCNKEKFKEVWDKIKGSIVPRRIFCWEFIWNTG